MDRTAKKSIYNYCEKLWDELNIKDNGSYPSKHDTIVLEGAAKHFNLTVEEIVAVHGEVSKEIADKAVKGMTQQQIKDNLKKIVEDNKETPWGKK